MGRRPCLRVSVDSRELLPAEFTRPGRRCLRDGLTENEAEVVGRHFKYLKHLVSEGVVVMAGRTLNTDESAFGIVVFASPRKRRRGN